MSFDYLISNANPALHEHLQKAHAERAAAFYAAWSSAVRCVASVVGGLVDRVRRIRRARATYHDLRALSDRQLRDIGLDRSEISAIADAVAAEAHGTSLTIADLRAREVSGSDVATESNVDVPHLLRHRSHSPRNQRQDWITASRPQDRAAA